MFSALLTERRKARNQAAKSIRPHGQGAVGSNDIGCNDAIRKCARRDHRRSHTPFPRDFALVAAFDP